MLKQITTLQWMGIIILFNTTLLGGASQLGDLALSPVAVKAILAAATLGNGFLGGLVTMFGGAATQLRTVSDLDGVEPIRLNAKAAPSLAAVAVDKEAPNVGAAASTTRSELQDIAKGTAAA